MTTGNLQVLLKNNYGELERLQECVEEFLCQHGVEAKVIYTMNLALEEMVTNVIKYGYDDADEHTIQVDIEKTTQLVQAVVSDDGHEFNPLNRATPDTSIPLEEREIGGLGIHLVRKMLDEVNYTRKESRNYFSMAKKI